MNSSVAIIRCSFSRVSLRTTSCCYGHCLILLNSIFLTPLFLIGSFERELRGKIFAEEEHFIMLLVFILSAVIFELAMPLLDLIAFLPLMTIVA